MKKMSALLLFLATMSMACTNQQVELSSNTPIYLILIVLFLVIAGVMLHKLFKK